MAGRALTGRRLGRQARALAGAAALIAALSATTPVAAAPANQPQPTTPQGQTAPAPGPTAPKEVAPYDDQLLRLAEILGTLHHLRPLCGADETQTWRSQMSSLIEAEQPAPDRRRRLIDRFNRAWRGVAEIHRTCTPAARELAQRLINEGTTLTHEVVSRWGAR